MTFSRISLLWMGLTLVSGGFATSLAGDSTHNGGIDSYKFMSNVDGDMEVVLMLDFKKHEIWVNPTFTTNDAAKRFIEALALRDWCVP